MRRVFPDHTYGPGPRTNCWWNETCDIPRFDQITGAQRFDVAVIGAGVTGLSAALTLAEGGARVAVLEAETAGWGASGRSGGFCCLGGGMLDDRALDRQFGRDGRLAFRAAEKAAVGYVEHLIQRFNLDVDRHSQGETVLAHRPKDMQALRQQQKAIRENYQVEPIVLEEADLGDAGMQGPFFGALTIPIGFGLNPRKYVAGLCKAVRGAGGLIFEKSPVQAFERVDGRFLLTNDMGAITADAVILATNAYSAESLSQHVEGCFMPCQSSVMVTRPLTDSDLDAQGWWSEQMCYDTRNLLHYFRLLPDRRFLFGMRGGLFGGARAEYRARERLLADFRKLFPGWRDVAATHIWSGMVALSRGGLPFAGHCPGEPGLYAALCYHGNGVAMGSLCGRIVAELHLGKKPGVYPAALQRPLRRFPLGQWRQLLLPPIYAGLMLQDL